VSKGVGIGRGTGFASVHRISQVAINRSGMRPESHAFVRGARAAGRALKPIVIVVQKGHRPYLEDGRHRLDVARERGDTTIRAVVRYVGSRGAVRKTEMRSIRID
jgi:hypothetical protein